MVQYSPQERSVLVTEFARTGSYQQTMHHFQQLFPNRAQPSKSTIHRNVVKYRQNGTSVNLNAERSGRPRTARIQQNIIGVRNALNANPNSSCRRNNLPHIHRSTFHRIINKDLRRYPYRIQRRFALRPGDFGRRIAYSQWMINRPQHFFGKVIISDEASFSLNGNVNSWNYRSYSDRRNPPRHFTYDRPDARQSVTVWVGLTGDNGIIGPFFINGNLNRQGYLTLLNGQVIPEIQRRYGIGARGAVPRMWWFQDGAPAHRAGPVMRRLRGLFPNRLVCLGEPQEWPPRSPDLTPLDFFLWGYVKSRVYTTPPADLRDLRNRVRNEINALRRTRNVRRSIRSMQSRAQICINVNGAQVEGRAGH